MRLCQFENENQQRLSVLKKLGQYEPPSKFVDFQKNSLHKKAIKTIEKQGLVDLKA
jgi:hypothetical protein